MFNKTVTFAIVILALTSTLVLFNQINNSFAETRDPYKLNMLYFVNYNMDF